MDILNSPGKHIDKSFDSQLREINNNIIRMGEIVVDLIEFARQTLDDPSDAIIQKARKLDKKLNALDFDVQQKAVAMIALRQPMGFDLRYVVSALKIASSMERMGDLAKSSCKKTAKFSSKISANIINDMKEINALATKMVNDVMIAFRDLSEEKANSVLGQDDHVDEIYHTLLNDVKDQVIKQPKLIANFADIVFAAKNMERIGDHCTKIADLVHYISSGEHVGKVATQKKQLAEQNS